MRRLLAGVAVLASVAVAAPANAATAYPSDWTNLQGAQIVADSPYANVLRVQAEGSARTTKFTAALASTGSIAQLCFLFRTNGNGGTLSVVGGGLEGPVVFQYNGTAYAERCQNVDVTADGTPVWVYTSSGVTYFIRTLAVN